MTPSDIVKANRLLSDRSALKSRLDGLCDASSIAVKFASTTTTAAKSGHYGCTDSGAFFVALQRVLTEQINLEIARIDQKLVELGVEVPMTLAGATEDVAA